MNDVLTLLELFGWFILALIAGVPAGAWLGKQAKGVR